MNRNLNIHFVSSPNWARSLTCGEMVMCVCVLGGGGGGAEGG